MDFEQKIFREQELEKEKQEPTAEELKAQIEALQKQNEEIKTENVKLRREKDIKRHEKEKYKERFEKAPVGFHVVDKDGVIVEVNEKWLKLMGYEAEEVIGKLIFDFITEEQRENAQLRHTARLNKEEEPSRMGPRKYITKDGKIIYAETVNSLIESEGEALGSQTMFRDITVYVEKYKRLQELFDQFSAESKHEIVNPLTSLGGFIKMLQRKIEKFKEEGNWEKVLEYVNIMIEEVDRLEKVMENLSFVGILSKEISFKKGDLNDLLNSVVEEYNKKEENENKKKEDGDNIEIKTLLDEEIYYDSVFMKKVFEELLVLIDDFNINDVKIESSISKEEAVINVKGKGDKMGMFAATGFKKKLVEKDAFISNKIDGTGGRFALACELVRWQNGNVDFGINGNEVSITIQLPSHK